MKKAILILPVLIWVSGDVWASEPPDPREFTLEKLVGESDAVAHVIVDTVHGRVRGHALCRVLRVNGETERAEELFEPRILVDTGSPHSERLQLEPGKSYVLFLHRTGPGNLSLRPNWGAEFEIYREDNVLVRSWYGVSDCEEMELDEFWERINKLMK